VVILAPVFGRLRFRLSGLADFFPPLFLPCFANLLGSSGLLFILRWHDSLSSCEGIRNGSKIQMPLLHIGHAPCLFDDLATEISIPLEECDDPGRVCLVCRSYVYPLGLGGCII